MKAARWGLLLAVSLQACGRARTDAKPVAIDESLVKDARALVVAFTASDCPVAKLYLPRLIRLEKEYRGRGVKFVLVYCNFDDKTHSTPVEFAVIEDRDGSLSTVLDARRTTEVFVIDPARRVRYRGAVDDQYGIGYTKDAPTKNYLTDALEAVLAGREPATASTEAPGCAIEREPKAEPRPQITFHRDVEPILQRRCQECHRPGEIGPFPLIKYSDVRGASKRLKEVVTTRRMPPWHADPKHGVWENDRRLTDSEIDTIVKWLDTGSPEGDPKDAPSPRKWVPGWKIGEPDAVYKFPKPIKVKAEGTIPYQYVRVKTNLKEDKWVTAVEIRPGAREVVHHILVFIEYPRNRWKEQTPVDGGLFYGYFAVMVPGEQPTVYLDGMGKFIPAGATLIFQIHYTATGQATEDQSSIGLIFAKEPVKHEVVTRGIINQEIRIPAGAANHEERANFTFTHDAKILSLFPHLHVRGKSFRFVALHTDGSEEVLLDVPAYDFNWQTLYRLKEPRFVKKGTTIRVIAHWDNSAGNPANPDATKTVHYGEQTWEEMLNGYVDFIKVGE